MWRRVTTALKCGGVVNVVEADFEKPETLRLDMGLL